MVLAFSLFAAIGCGERDASTVIDLQLGYDESWALTALEIRVNGAREQMAPTHAVRLLVDDVSDGESIAIEVSGWRGGDVMATGETAVTVDTRRALSASIYLRPASCTTCSIGDARCFDDGVASCIEAGPGCMTWSTPVPCPVDASACSNGACAPTCVDECASGQTRCESSIFQSSCGNSDGDPCLEWGPAAACAATQTCTVDRCVDPSCVDDCTAGTCSGDQYAACTDTNGDGCRELAAPVVCTSADACQVPTCTTSGCETTPMACGTGTCIEGSCAYPPSNHADVGDFENTGIDIDVPSGTTFDTDAHCTTPSLLGRCEAVTGAAMGLCVCRADAFALGGLRIRGSRGLVLLASDRVDIGGAVEVWAGGRTVFTPASGLSGGAGASFGSWGGNSANTPYGLVTLDPLCPGTAGQRGCGFNASGGPGGGAIQISALREISITGRVEANGGGGGTGSGSGATCQGGGGGGSGGGILIEAPNVTLTGILSAVGGGGGGGASNNHAGGTGGQGGWGGSGGSGGQGADGHGCSLQGFTSGGDGGRGGSGSGGGGSGQTWDQRNCLSTEYVGGGGGGGGVGRIRINTRTTFTSTSVISPPATLGTVP